MAREKSRDPSDLLAALPAALPLLQLVDLLYPPLVPAAFEVGLHPHLDDPLDTPRAQHVARQAEDVEIVVPPAQLGRHFVLARGRPNTREFVGRDRHPNARAADEYAPLDLAAAHLFRHQSGEVWVV